MRVHLLTGVILYGLLLIGCGSSKNVYELPESKQKGLTYQVYQESPDQVFDTVSQMLEEYGSKKLISEGWEIKTSDKQSGTIETNWKETGSDMSAGGGNVAGSEASDRYKIEINISEVQEGTRLDFELHSQHRFSMGRDEEEGSSNQGDWEDMEVKKKDAEKMIQPLLKQLSEGDLTIRKQSSGT